jgi:hypothetical protein
MKVIELIKKELGETKLPPNTREIISIIEKGDNIISEMSKLLVKVSYETIAEILLGNVDIGNYNALNSRLLSKSLDNYDELKLELKKVEINYEEYEHFYDVLDNNASKIIGEDISNYTDLILSSLEKMQEDEGGKEIFNQASQITTINEFKRFS